MNILPFHLNVPNEITLNNSEGTIVQGRYGDRVMFSLTDGRVMYVPPFVASKIQAEGVTPGERFQVCKTQVRNGNRRSIEWTVRRIESERESDQIEAESQLESDLRASIHLATTNGGAAGNNGTQTNAQPATTTKLEHALRTAISAAYNAERYGTELGYVVRFDADAIKSMAITVLINMNGGGNHR